MDNDKTGSIQQSKGSLRLHGFSHDSDPVLPHDLDREGGLAHNEPIPHRIEALIDDLQAFLLAQVGTLQRVEHRGHQVLGVAMRGLAGLDH